MTVGERIRNKRIELSLSQEELAKRMGYSGKTTISKAENWGNEITTTKVKKFADALGVSFEYLMGWEEEPKKEEALTPLMAKYLASVTKNAQNMQFLDKFNKLSEKNKYVVLTLMDSLITDSIPTLEPPQNQE